MSNNYTVESLENAKRRINFEKQQPTKIGMVLKLKGLHHTELEKEMMIRREIPPNKLQLYEELNYIDDNYEALMNAAQAQERKRQVEQLRKQNEALERAEEQKSKKEEEEEERKGSCNIL